MEQVPVLIVGGGGAGLSASLLMSTLGIDSLLVSAHTTTSTLPKAHVLNQRTMEIFTEIGVASEVYRRGAPAENMKATAWYAGLAGDHDGYGRQLARLELWGAGYTDPDYVAASPCRTADLPQARLEPLLRCQAEQLNPGMVRFGHELVALRQNAAGVVATIRDKVRASDYAVHARYVVAADGGRTVGRLTGMKMTGRSDIMRMISVHMTADLSQWARDEDVLIRWLVNPDFGGAWSSGVLIPMGPEHWGPRSEEWVFNMQLPPGGRAEPSESRVLAEMRARLGIPDFMPKIYQISFWTMQGLVAERFRVNRVFFAGDAAHRQPQTGGLGLNSAVQDVYNLCWKIATVLRGQAGEGLLDTYETERRQVSLRNIDLAVTCAMNHRSIAAAMGVDPEKSPTENWTKLKLLWSDSDDGKRRRHELSKAIASQTIEFRHHNLELGYTYDSAAVVDDGSPSKAGLDEVRLYEPSTKPGHPMPHAFVEHAGRRIALGELVHGGHFLVIAGECGHGWVEAGSKLATKHNLPLRAQTVGVVDGDYIDVRAAWLRHREFSDSGAVLVRPDRYIAFRSMRGVDDPRSGLSAALSQVLDADIS